MNDTAFTPAPWVVIGPVPTGATEPGVPQTLNDPDVYTIKAQPSPFLRGFTMTIAEVYGAENAHLVGATTDLYEALKKLTFAARTSGGTAGRDEALVAACEVAERTLAKARGEVSQ